MNHEEVREAALRELGDRPGVVGIGLGYKITGGEMTDVVSLQVYVEAKRPLEELAPDGVMPVEFGGMPTDVLEPKAYTNLVDTEPCAERAQHGTLTGGITISTMNPIATGYEAGTLGFLVTIPGLTPPHDIGAVTNNHVVANGNGALKSTMYQPKFKQLPDGSYGVLPTGQALVGDIVALPPRANDAHGTYVDAALIKVDICISSWCNSNLGQSFNKDIQGLALGTPARNDIHDVAPASSLTVGDPVYKVGRTTGRTVGRISKLHVPNNTFDGTPGDDVIEIDAVSMQGTGNCGGALRFADHGDSGSALITAARNLVGVVNAADPASPNLATACYIQPVLAALGGVVPITETHPVHGNPAAEGMGAVVMAGPDRRAELRGAFYGTPQGPELAAEFDRHRLEVVHLVNTVRRVTIAWHRHQGPAFLNRLIANARDPAVPIPREIEGITRAGLLETMADVLSAHGSPELAAAIARRRDGVIARTREVEDLQQLVDDLAGEPVP